MYKRLTISLVLMGLAAFSLAAGAVAYFSDSGDADVLITAGSADISFDVNQDCDGDVEFIDSDLDQAELLEWSGIVPGDVTNDCVTVTNSGDGTVAVYADHIGPFTGDLLNHVNFRYWTYVGGDHLNNLTNRCGAASANADAAPFRTANDGRGCALGSLDEGQSLNFRVQATFVDNGNDQNALAGGTLGFGVVVTGYTG